MTDQTSAADKALTDTSFYIDIGDTDYYPLTSSLYWFEDKSNSLDINKASRPEILQLFTPNNKTNFNAGFSDSPVWFYLPLQRTSTSNINDDTDSTQRLLTIDHPPLDLLDIYIRSSQGVIEHLQLGDSLPYDQRPYDDMAFIVPITIGVGEKVDIFIRVDSTSSIQMPVSISTPQNLISQLALKNTRYGFYFGVMAVMFIYNLFVYLSTRDKSYLHYIAYIASFGLLQAAISGHGFAYLWPSAIQWEHYSVPILVSLSCYFGLNFSRHFLALKDHSPSLDNVAKKTGILALLVIAASSYFTGGTSIQIAIVLTIITAMVILSSGIYSLNANYRAARFFLLAWCCLLPGVIIQGLIVADIIQGNPYTSNASLLGSLVEVVVLSLALADRINTLRRENQKIDTNSQSKLQRANTELSEMLSTLEQNNRLKDQFLATISHELRTPMNGVEGSLDLISTSNLSRRQLNYLETAKYSAREMTSHIDAILYFSEIQSGDLKLNQKPFEIREILSPISIDLRHQCQQKNLEFNWHIDKNVPMIIDGDSDQILLVLKQLVDNAIKFTSTGQVSVYISTGLDERSQRQMLSFSIIDTGSGIPSQDLKTIFNAFQQLDGSDNRQHRGMGIGLAICHQIASLMGGHLAVKSTIDQGTEFTFTVPLQTPVHIENSHHDDDQLNSRNIEKTILVAEDNLVNQMVLKAMLSQMGCIILTASNGEEVFSLLESHPIDLIMMDCQMPIMDGFEATRRIRNSAAAYSSVPIIAVTANAMSSDSVRCINAGMNDYIKKPIHREVVERKVKRWLQNGKLAAI